MFSLFNKAKGKDGLVGIYFSADSVTLAHIVSPDSDPELKLCEEFKAETLEDKAKVLEKQVNKLGLEDTKASFILSPTDYKLFLVESPQVEPEEMTGAVKWKIKDLISQPVDEMAITIFPVPDDAYRGQSDMVYAVAAKKSKIHEIIDLVNNSGLVLKTIDIPELVMKNLTAVSADDSNGLAILDLRGTGSILNLSKKRCDLPDTSFEYQDGCRSDEVRRLGVYSRKTCPGDTALTGLLRKPDGTVPNCKDFSCTKRI